MHGTCSVNRTQQSHPSSISSLEHCLRPGRAAEHWGAGSCRAGSASGWHCKPIGVAEAGPWGGMAAQALRTHALRCAHICCAAHTSAAPRTHLLRRASRAARGSTYKHRGNVTARPEESCQGGRGMDSAGGKEASPRGWRCCSGVGYQQCPFCRRCGISPDSESADQAAPAWATDTVHTWLTSQRQEQLIGLSYQPLLKVLSSVIPKVSHLWKLKSLLLPTLQP